MADNFNLKGYLKKNTLLNENIGGYVDIKPVKEEIGTAMEEDDTEDFGTTDDRIMGLGGDKLLAAAQFLIDDGFELEDLMDFLRNKLV